MRLQIRKTFLFGALVFCFLNAEASPLTLAPDSRLDSNQSTRISRLLNYSATQLPPAVQELLEKRQVQVVFAKASKPSIQGWVSGTGIFGDKRNIKKIQLNENFIERIGKNSEKQSADELDTELSGVLIHEIAHIYDESQRYTPEEMPGVQKCNQERLQLMQQSQNRQKSFSDIDSLLSFRCRQTLKKWKLISDSYRYQMLAGFKEQIFNKNISDARAADPYEKVSSPEHYAENFRLFITDPEYRCRRPALFRFFSTHFKGFSPEGSETECPLKFRLAKSGEIVPLDRNRVYEVQYILAGKGDGIESRFGHSLLRVIVCKEGRPLSADCRLDVDDHLTIALLGDVDDLRMNPLKGLFGLYKSSFYVARFRETLREYNKDQFRSISSYPINLKRLEILQLLDLLSQNYWEYRGEYYFLSQNCATELGEILRATIDSNDFLYDSNMTPKGLLKSLARFNLVDEKIFEFFPSHKVKLEEQWARLGHLLEENLGSLDHFLSESAETRLEYFNELSQKYQAKISATARSTYQSSGAKDALAIYAMLPAVFSLVENQIADKSLSSLGRKKQSLLVQFIEKDQGLETLQVSGEIRNSFMELRKIRSELRLQDLPNFLGYGIPTEADLGEISAIVKDLKTKESIASRKVGLALDEIFQTETSEISQIVKNRNHYIESLKMLAKQFRSEIIESGRR